MNCRNVAALMAGLLYPLAFAPYNFWPLALLSPALLFYLGHGQRPKAAAWLGLCYGLGLFGFGISWLHISMVEYGDTPYWLAIPLTGIFAAFIALFAALVTGLTSRFGGSPWVFAGLWLLADWLRSWLLTGFPWLYAGYAMIDTPLARLAPWGGIWLVTLVVIMWAAALAALVRERNRANVGLLAAALALSAVIALPQDFTKQHPQPLQVALAQGNVPQDMRWLTSEQQATREIYRSLTENIPEHTLVIWPEAALTEFYHTAQEFLEEQAALLAAKNSALITGIPVFDSHHRRFYNAVMTITGGTGHYFKQRLVPFGEYVPLEDFIRGVIPFFDLPMSSFSRGTRQQQNLLAKGYEITPLICYEVLYPDLLMPNAQNAHFLLTISNDAWFGDSAGPKQHFQMARMRSLETGRWLLRATNTGITALVAPDGSVHSQLPMFTRDVLLGEVYPVTGKTPFMVTGVAPTLTLALIMVAFFRRVRDAPPST